jgi:hypothetical protein
MRFIMSPKLTKIETSDDLVMILYYDNGEIRSLDFKQEDLSGDMSPLKTKNFFKKAYLSDYGMVEFPGDIQLDPQGLYKDSVAGDLRKKQTASYTQRKILTALKKVID